MKPQRGARPIRSKEVYQHHHDFGYQPVSLLEYTDTWRRWITTSKTKTLDGLEKFQHADFVNGTSQTFDHFWLKHRDRRPVSLRGEFQYHACVNKSWKFCWIDSADNLRPGDCLVISLPFSDSGCQHADWQSILDRCDDLDIPVCVDLAYWGISQSVDLDLDSHQCIQQLTCSLSKPFCTLENHRVGIRFSRHYNNDGISMINETNMQNIYSMSLGCYFMMEFTCDWIPEKFRSAQIAACEGLALVAADTVIFGHGNSDYEEYNRGVPNSNRICISEFLHDFDEDNKQ
jgi:hypothetical protein